MLVYHVEVREFMISTQPLFLRSTSLPQPSWTGWPWFAVAILAVVDLLWLSYSSLSLSATSWLIVIQAGLLSYITWRASYIFIERKRLHAFLNGASL